MTDIAGLPPLPGPRTGGGLRYMVGAAFCFSLMSLFVKLAGRGLPVAEIVFVRAAVTLVLSWWLLRRARVDWRGHNRPMLLLRGAAGFAALFCFFFAVTRLPLADVTVLHFTNPVLTALWASIFLHESMGAREIGGLALCVVGVVLVAQPSFLFGAGPQALDPVGVGAALTGAFLSAIAYTSVRKLRETDHHLVVVFYFPLVATPASVPFLIGRAVWPTPVEWLLLVAIGVVTQTAQVFLTKGLHRERAGRAMSVSYVQVVFAAVWGMLVFGNAPDPLGIVGAVLVFGGALLVAGKL